MPIDLALGREQLRERVGTTTSVRELAEQLVACHAEDDAAELTRDGLLLFRKISQGIRKQLHAAADEDNNSVVDNIVQLFGVEDDAFAELEEAIASDRLAA